MNLDEDAFIKYSKEGKVAVNSQVIKEEKVKDEQEYNQLIVPSGKRARIELSDGTRLVVNSQSKVVYPRRFKGDIRKIYTQGEVFLEVAHDLLNIADGSIVCQKQVDVAEYISWIDGIMLLNGNTLSQIIQKLSIYYGVSIQCDPLVGSEKVYGKLDLKDDIDEVIECIQQTLPFTIEKRDTSIYLNK